MVRAASSTLQFSAEPRVLEKPTGASQIGLADEHPPRQETNGAFERTHVLVGDEDMDFILAKKRADGGDEHEIVGAQELDHRAVLAPIRLRARTDA